MKLLASASTKEKITEFVNSYFYSTKYSISDNLDILHPEKQITNFKITLKKNRYRFEQI